MVQLFIHLNTLILLNVISLTLFLILLYLSSFFFFLAPFYFPHPQLPNLSLPSSSTFSVNTSSSPLYFNSPLAQCSSLNRPIAQTIDTTYHFPDYEYNPFSLGFWNETIEERYLKRIEKSQFPIKVILMFHSHTDPGWLKTFETYYLSDVINILNNAVEELTRHPELRFIWSEVSFLDRWWKGLDEKPELKQSFIKLVEKGQLELVSGGWVMTDEAVSHYYSMMDQLIEGHQWIRTNLGISLPPKNSWSCDPFGHSGTYPYFLHKSGVKNMVIQRIHFSWKQVFAIKQRFEFWWNQVFHKASKFNSESSMFCHVMPYELYNFKHGCGPSTRTCLEYDFRKIPDEYSESRSNPINEQNLQEKAEILLGQYGRTASLFPHNVALIPLGDDFRYNFKSEWDQQRINFGMLINYINKNKDKFNNTEIKFGTLKDYFDEVEKRSKSLGQYPSLLGDFFPYADGYGSANYWTGYYTSNPFWKQLGRDLEHYLRSAEILYSLTYADALFKKMSSALARFRDDYQYLTLARQNLGLFQHHDAVTGTSKYEVMKDYGKRLHRSIIHTLRIMSHAAQYTLMSSESHSSASKVSIFSVLQIPYYNEHFDLISIKTSHFTVDRKLFIFNSHFYSIQTLCRFRISKPLIFVEDAQTGEKLPHQVIPVWSSFSKIASTDYEIVFTPKLSPLSITTFNLHISDTGPNNESKSAVDLFLTDYLNSHSVKNKFHRHYQTVFTVKDPPLKDIELSSPYFIAIFDSSTGFLKQIVDKKTQKKRKLSLNLYYYKSTDGLSGAYLFRTITDEPFIILDPYPSIKLVTGSIFSELYVKYLNAFEIIFRVYNTESPIGAAVYIETRVDVSNKDNYIDKEIVIRFESEIKNYHEKYSSQIFYTDSNGFQSIPRLFNPESGIMGNYYPVTSYTYIEDDKSRLTFLTSCSHGASSPKLGSIEVMLDRRIGYDDSRGLSEPLLNNVPIRPRFFLLLEDLIRPNDKNTVSSLSALANHLISILLYPPIIFSNDNYEEKQFKSKHNFVKDSTSCSLNLVNIRTLPLPKQYESPSTSTLLILHNRTSSCSFSSSIMSNYCNQNNSFDFDNLQVSSISETSLTGLYELKSLKSLKEIQVNPMELGSFKITFNSN